MEIISINGRQEPIYDIYDGLQMAEEAMGYQWYDFMKQELAEADAAYADLEQELHSYKADYEGLLDDNSRNLGDIQELAEQALDMIEVRRKGPSKILSDLIPLLKEIKDTCYRNR